MKSLQRVLLVLLPTVLGLGLVGIVGAAPAGAVPLAPTFTCTGAISNATSPPTLNQESVPTGTYSSLVMPPGSFCVVAAGAVTVQDGIMLGRGSALLVVEGYPPGYTTPYFGSLTVQGPVTVGPDAFLGFSWDGTTPFTVTPFTLNGPVTVEPNGLLGLLASSVRGPVWALNPSAVYLYGSTVTGGVNILGGGGRNDPEEAFIGGFDLSPYYRFVDMEGNAISGPLSVIGYASPGTYDGFAMFLAGNTVTGPVTLIGNSVEPPGVYSIGSEANTIHGPATCAWNSPTIVDFAPSAVSGPILGAQGHLCFG